MVLETLTLRFEVSTFNLMFFMNKKFRVICTLSNLHEMTSSHADENEIALLFYRLLVVVVLSTVCPCTKMGTQRPNCSKLSKMLHLATVGKHKNVKQRPEFTLVDDEFPFATLIIRTPNLSFKTWPFSLNFGWPSSSS